MTGTAAIGTKALRREDGFTLIDMLFVVGLVGVLSSLAIPGMMRAKTAAQSASALGTVRVVRTTELRDHVRARVLCTGLPDADRQAR